TAAGVAAATVAAAAASGGAAIHVDLAVGFVVLVGTTAAARAAESDHEQSGPSKLTTNDCEPTRRSLHGHPSCCCSPRGNIGGSAAKTKDVCIATACGEHRAAHGLAQRCKTRGGARITDSRQSARLRS